MQFNESWRGNLLRKLEFCSKSLTKMSNNFKKEPLIPHKMYETVHRLQSLTSKMAYHYAIIYQSSQGTWFECSAICFQVRRRLRSVPTLPTASLLCGPEESVAEVPSTGGGLFKAGHGSSAATTKEPGHGLEQQL